MPCITIPLYVHHIPRAERKRPTVLPQEFKQPLKTSTGLYEVDRPHIKRGKTVGVKRYDRPSTPQ